jgi:hypothetical protein
MERARRGCVIRDDRGSRYRRPQSADAEASAPFVLLPDDDAALRDGEAIERAVRLLEADPRLAAVGFAQCDRAGVRWDERMQPAQCPAACLVPSFIG